MKCTSFLITNVRAGLGFTRFHKSSRLTTHLQYQPWKTGPWLSFNWRYDSGLVAGPVPCAGGNCIDGPNGTDSIVDVSGITPDQQFQSGLYCGSVYATPTSSISPSGLCPRRSTGPNTSRFQPPAPRTMTTIRRASRRALTATIGFHF